MSASVKVSARRFRDAANDGDEATVKRGLAQQPPVDINATDDSGRTALYFAVWWKRAAIVSLSLAQPPPNAANVNARANNGATPLHIAARNNVGAPIIEELLAHKADITATDNDGWTVLHWIIYYTGPTSLDNYKTETEAIEWLRFWLDHGALTCITVKNNAGRTAAEHADTRGASEVAKFLRAYKYTPSQQSSAEQKHSGTAVTVSVSPAPVEQWTAKEVVAWMTSKFPPFAQLFQVNCVDGATLVSATDAELSELGVDKALVRRNMLAKIHDLQMTTTAATTGKPAEEKARAAGSKSFASRVASSGEADDVELGKVVTPISGLAEMPIVALDKAIESISSVKALDEHCYAATLFAEQYMRTHGKDPHGLSEDEMAAIHVYTQEWTVSADSLYAKLNSALRDAERAKLKPFFPYLFLLVSGLRKLPRVSSEVSVWRGVKLDLRKHYTKGSKMLWWAFNSCTTDAAVLKTDQFLGKSGARTLFSIKVTHGVRIEAYSSLGAEAEVLLLPGTLVEVATDALELGHGLTLIELKEITPKFPMLK